MTNEGYAQSGVLLRLKLICAEQYTGPVRDPCAEQLVEFREHKGSIEALLDTADVTMLLSRG